MRPDTYFVRFAPALLVFHSRPLLCKTWFLSPSVGTGTPYPPPPEFCLTTQHLLGGGLTPPPHSDPPPRTPPPLVVGLSGNNDGQGWQ